MGVPSTLVTYYDTQTITAVKSFILEATDKTFTVVILYWVEKARVFVLGNPTQLSLIFVGKA
jgi:hypothetical protein